MVKKIRIPVSPRNRNVPAEYFFLVTQERIERNLLYQDNYRSTERTEGKILENESSHLKRKKTGRFFFRVLSSRSTIQLATARSTVMVFCSLVEVSALGKDPVIILRDNFADYPDPERICGHREPV
jgi:hypothetical protein